MLVHVQFNFPSENIFLRGSGFLKKRKKKKSSKTGNYFKVGNWEGYRGGSMIRLKRHSLLKGWNQAEGDKVSNAVLRDRSTQCGIATIQTPSSPPHICPYRLRAVLGRYRMMMILIHKTGTISSSESGTHTPYLTMLISRNTFSVLFLH